MVVTDVSKSNKSPQLNDQQIKDLVDIRSPIQLAVVVDVIFNENHVKLQDEYKQKINPQTVPLNYKNEPAKENDVDFSYIGRAKVRILSQEKKSSVEKLPWAIPLDQTITQYPLVNELVLVQKVGNNYYYSKPLNKFNFPTNIDYTVETVYSENGKPAVPFYFDGNRATYTSAPIYSKYNNIGYVGEYFISNPFIRLIRKNEGDTAIESRFGQSIRFSAYDNNRLNDKGSYPSYALNSNLLKESSGGGYGNPKITIRNRQRNISLDEPQQLHPKLPPIPKITPSEKNFGGQIDEDINNDGSTIQITSGKTESDWKTTVYKSIFGKTSNGEPTEEQVRFNPKNSTPFVLPTLNGDQIVINTDRLVLSSRFAETLHFSKKRYAVTTDSEYTVDANDNVVITTNNTACINAPQIFLGQYGETNEPVLLGQTTVDWMYDLCNWLLDHVHWHHHVHPHPHTHPRSGNATPENTKDANPDQTQIPVQQIKLKLLRDNLHKTLSRRVFVTGGGYAPGSNGVKPPGSGGECKDPVEINTVTGAGVVGDFKGRNRREGPVQVEFEFED
jgi:hypothetical protein